MKAAKNSKEVAKILQKSCKKVAKCCKMLQFKLQKVLRVARSDDELQKVAKSQKLVLFRTDGWRYLVEYL